MSDLVLKLNQVFSDFSDLHEQIVDVDKSGDICTLNEYMIKYKLNTLKIWQK